MKKYIFIVLAAAGTMACSKLTPVDSIPVTELPEDETTETVAPKEGETITIQLAQTKVTLNGTDYVFEGNEQIVVKAASGPVATLSNSTKDPNIFTGVFEKPLGKERDIFDFYYNCTDASGKASYVQNGQPWLEHKGVEATRAPEGGYAYVVEGVQLRQPKEYVALAITSYYDCTVDFHTLSTALPTGETTISGIQLDSESKKPYFVNITNGMKGGFYLTVTNPEGQKMYTSYGTGTTDGISSNQLIKTKTFEAFSITGEVDTDSSRSFMSTYDLYCNSQINKANSTNSNILSSGIVNFPVTGISKSLLTFKSIKIIFSDGVEVSTTEAVEWVSKTLKVTIPSTPDHNKLGEVKISSVTAYFSTPDNDNLEVQANATSFIRYITGLPYNACPTKDTWEYSNIHDWNISKNTYGGGLMYDSNGYIKKSFYIPQEVINASVSHSGYTRKGFLTSKTTTFSIYVGSTNLYTKTSKNTSSPGEKTNVSYDIQFTKTANYIQCMNTVRVDLSTYATTNNITVHYR